MGTLEKFEKDHNNNPRLYTYGNANVQPPTETVRNLICYHILAEIDLASY